MPDIPKLDTTPLHWNPLTSINKDTQRNTYKGIRNGISIVVSGASFKYRWFISALVIEGYRHNVNIITATSTTPGRSKDQEEYRSELAVIYHIMIIVEDIFSKHNT